MDFKQIEAFVNVVRYKSFSKAADATFFTQPTISAHIQNLENELDTKLLDRKGRTIEMTPQGAKFYKYAVEMMNAREEAYNAIGGSNDNISGILEIQTSSIPGVTFVPDLLAGFRRKHTDVKYYVSMSDTDAVVDNIIERRGEIGFIGDKISNNAIESALVASDRVVMIAPLSYGLNGVITIEQAVDLPFIWRETGSATRKAFESTVAKMGYDKNAFDVAGLFNDLDTIIRSVEAGLGVAVISERVARNVSDRVSILNIEGFQDQRDFYMIRLKNASLSPAASAFHDYVLNHK